MNVVTSNSFLENGSILRVESWSFLTNHARVLLCIARNRYQIQAHRPLPEPASQEPAIGDVLAVLAGDGREPAADREPARAAPVTATGHALTSRRLPYRPGVRSRYRASSRQ